ncbi:MAG: replication-relaxation family protein [Candidatus Woykebacteria bacterium]
MESPNITKKQTEIPYLLYRFRFLNTRHIQTMMNHKDPRRSNRWLLDLTKKGILERTYSKKFGENTKPAVYFLAKGSRNILKGRKGVNEALLNRIYRERTRSQSFRDQSMFIADVYLNLKSQTKGEYHFFTKSELEDHKYLPNPHPEAYIAINEGKELKRYFLKIIDKQVPRFVIRNQIKDLFKYYSSEKWQNQTKNPFPTVLIICPSYVTRAFVAKFIAETRGYEEAELNFYLSTEDQIKAKGIKPDIWQKAG